MRGRPTEEKDAIGASVQAALVSNLGVPETDRYQLFAEYDTENFRHAGGYLGLTYTDQLLIIEITFLDGRNDGIKRSLLADINENLVSAGVVGADDAFIVINEIAPANISLAGPAQRAGEHAGGIAPTLTPPILTTATHSSLT